MGFSSPPLAQPPSRTIVGTCVVLDFARYYQSTIKSMNIFHVIIRSLLSVLFIVTCLVSRSVLLTVTNFSPTFSDVDNYIHYAPTLMIKARSYACVIFYAAR